MEKSPASSGPSCPRSLLPQQSTSPLPSSAHAKSDPTAIWVTPWRPATWVGVALHKPTFVPSVRRRPGARDVRVECQVSELLMVVRSPAPDQAVGEERAGECAARRELGDRRASCATLDTDEGVRTRRCRRRATPRLRDHRGDPVGAQRHVRSPLSPREAARKQQGRPVEGRAALSLDGAVSQSTIPVTTRAPPAM